MPLMTKGERFIRCRGHRHGSRWIRFLSDTEDRGMVLGGSDLSDAEDRGMVLVLHHSDIPCSKGERLFRGRSKEFRLGEQP